MKLLYKPVGILLGIAGGLVARASFRRLWRVVSDKDDAPQATDRQRGWREVVVGAAMQGAVFAAVKAIVDRAGAAGFHRLTGVWPGDEESEKRRKKT
jgi:hypothetical protein